MACLSSSWLYRDRLAADCYISGRGPFIEDINPRRLRSSFLGSVPSRKVHLPLGIRRCLSSKSTIPTLIQCKKKNEEFDPSSIQPPPYHVYMDSTSGQLEPASGARASIPGKEYWPEGTASRARAGRAPAPSGKSEGKPSYGKSPGSRRKNFKANTSSTDTPSNDSFSTTSLEQGGSSVLESSGSISDDSKDPSEEFVIYQTEEENLSSYELDKRLGRPHPFMNPTLKKSIEETPHNSEELWWNWRKPDKGIWSKWQRREPSVDAAFAKAMAETGQIKLYGDEPTVTETALARARKEVFKEERLQAEKQRLAEIGPIAYYSEWVKAWKRDTSREAVQRHYEETGEDENAQLIEMFLHQTAEEYRIMMGTDTRIKRDPLAMRMREDQIKEIWGGDPVYPTINYIQDPNEVNDYRGANMHEPSQDIVLYLMEQGVMLSREDLKDLLAKDTPEEAKEEEIEDIDELAKAVDIGESDDEDDGEVGLSDDDNDVEDKVQGGNDSEESTDDNENDVKESVKMMDDTDNEVEEKITRNGSILRTTPQLQRSKGKLKKNEPMSLKEAVADAENLTDFLMDFDEQE